MRAEPSSRWPQMTHSTRQTMRGAVAVMALCVAASCRQAQPPSVPRLPPLGPGPTLELPVAGGVSRAPVIAAQSPFVAVAFVASDERGARVYLATSVDNGATFARATPVPNAAPGGAYEDLDVSVVADAQARGDELRVKVQWRRADGQTASTLVAIPARQVPPRDLQPGDTARGTAVATCENDGEVLLVAGFKGAGPVSVNHSLPLQRCEAGSASAVVDARRWVHTAWVGGRDAAARRVFYAAAPDRDWFGGAHALVDAGQMPSHVRLTTDPNDTIVAVWDAQVGATRQVVLRQILPAHHGPPTLLPLTHLSAGEGGVEPAVASIDGGVVVAWRALATGTIAVRRVGLDAICDATAVAAPGVPQKTVAPR